MNRWLLVWALTAGAAAGSMEFANVDFFPVKHAECKGFVAIQENCLEFRLYYVSPEKELCVLDPPPPELFPNDVAQIVQSPDRDKVFILSYGEGHPGLAIYRISDLIAYADRSARESQQDLGAANDPAPAVCLRELDPYPGDCGKVKWIGNSIIQFESSGADYRELDPDSRQGKRLADGDETVRVWHWDLASDSFTIASEKPEKAQKNKSHTAHGKP